MKNSPGGTNSKGSYHYNKRVPGKRLRRHPATGMVFYYDKNGKEIGVIFTNPQRIPGKVEQTLKHLAGELPSAFKADARRLRNAAKKLPKGYASAFKPYAMPTSQPLLPAAPSWSSSFRLPDANYTYYPSRGNGKRLSNKEVRLRRLLMLNQQKRLSPKA